QRYGLEASPMAWTMQLQLLQFLVKAWEQPDWGIWEVRGEPRHFTFSKIMAWVAFDRAVKSVEQYGFEGPADDWRKLRQRIQDDILVKAFDTASNSFVQFYGAQDVDASLLMIPQLGFLPPEDSRVRGTIARIERDLCHDGFVCRYRTGSRVDGLPPGEGS